MASNKASAARSIGSDPWPRAVFRYGDRRKMSNRYCSGPPNSSRVRKTAMTTTFCADSTDTVGCENRDLPARSKAQAASTEARRRTPCYTAKKIRIVGAR